MKESSVSQRHRPPVKAYRNEEFLASRDARTLRILSEYLEPESRLERYNVDDTIVFFGSARAKPEDPQFPELAQFYRDADELAFRLTQWSKGLSSSRRRFLICTGGGPGLMEAANRGASRARGLSVGLGISLPLEQGLNEFVSREVGFEFHYFFMRKFWFVNRARALVVFPGGFGTCDELFEVLTLVQTGKTSRPRPIVLYGRSFWNEIINWEALVRWGVIDAQDLNLMRFVDTVDEAMEFLTDELTRIHQLQE
jgi:hypothetical protein